MRAVPEPVGLPPGANNRAAAPLASATSITVKAKIKVRRDGIVLLFAHPDEGTSPAGVFEIEHEGKDADRQDADQYTDDGDDHHRQDVLGGPQRAHQEVAQIARIHLFEEGEVEAELAAEKNVPQKDPTDEGAGRRCGNPAALDE